MITFEEIHETLQKAGLVVADDADHTTSLFTESSLQATFDNLDENGSGSIQYVS